MVPAASLLIEVCIAGRANTAVFFTGQARDLPVLARLPRLVDRPRVTRGGYETFLPIKSRSKPSLSPHPNNSLNSGVNYLVPQRPRCNAGGVDRRAPVRGGETEPLTLTKKGDRSMSSGNGANGATHESLQS